MYKGQNPKLGNLRNFQLPPTKQLQALKKFPSFPSFQFLYKCQNQKLGNLGNFQLPPTKQLQVLKKFLSFASFRFLYKGQNRKLRNLGNFQLPPAKQLQVLKYFRVFPVCIRTKIENSENSEISNLQTLFLRDYSLLNSPGLNLPNV